MTNKYQSACAAIVATLRGCLLTVALLLVVIGSTNAQTESSTPGTLTPGLPSGSYALSGFDGVNLFNGNLDFHLPLLKVSGRGGAQFPVTLKIEERWRVEPHTNCSPCGPVYYPTYNWWTGYNPGYGPGVLEARVATWGEQQDSAGNVWPTSALTRLTFTTSDGTEFELRDAGSNGAPEPVSVPYYPPGAAFFNRGSVFVTSDGTSATFISCALDGTLIPVYDDTVPVPASYLAGFLLLRDGIRYRIDGGLVSWMQDRNGNRIKFFYDGGRVNRIVDSLGRQVTISYDVNEPAPYGLCDKITFQGYLDAPRVIRISKDMMSNVLRSGFSIRTFHDLFPSLSGSSYTSFNDQVVSAVWLPDGRSYKFYYNDYGELSRVLLPTGGAIEYDWDAGNVNPPFPGGDAYRDIYRRMVERRVYPTGGTGADYESKTTYSKQQTSGGYVDVKEYGSGASPLVSSRHYFNGDAPDTPNSYTGLGYLPWKNGKEYKTEAFDTDGTTVLQRVEHFFDQTPPGWWAQYGYSNDYAPSNNPRITDTLTTWVQTSQVAKQSYSYDAYNNKTAIQEFDYGASAPPAYPTRRTEIDYVTTGELNGIDYAGSSIASNVNALPYLRSLPQEQRVYSVSNGGSNTLQAKTHFYYDQYALTDRPSITGWQSPVTAARGNLTSTSRWLDTTGGWITTSQTYDIAGHVIQTTDAKGNTSLIDFANSFNTYAFPTTFKTPTPDPSGQRGWSARLQTVVDYDFSSGLVNSITDPNLQVTTASYNDALDRLTTITRPAGGGQTTYVYSDLAGSLFVETRTAQNATQTLDGYQYFDGLGRSTGSSQSEGAGSIFRDTQYDALGRVLQVSNPYRPGDTKRWTITQYDALSRVRTVTKPGGAATTNVYTGNSVTITDPQTKSRTTVSDALGRVTSVTEDPGSGHLNYQTSYVYDALDDLRRVIQGSQTRYFGYDSLKRLIRVKNPEQDVNTYLPAFTDPVTGNTQWAVGFVYDNDSNILTKTDPRNITCTYTYDAMNRVWTRVYSNDPNQTPAVDYKYDGAGTNGQYVVGKLTAVNTSGSFVSSYTYDTFDPMGRVQHSTQTTDGNIYGMSYSYDFAGNLISETYPSNRVVSTAFDVAGRINDVSSGATHYVSSFSYSAHGGVTDVKLGNNLWEHTTFETNRLQPTEIDLGSSQGASDKLKLNYDYGPLTTNNGNVMGQTITIPIGPTLVQGYTYDPLNRLKDARENNGSSWIQTFLYDPCGNRTIDPANTTSGLVGPNPQISSTTSRITSAGYSYDYAGNLKTDAAGHNYDYDAENMQVKYDATVAQYFYDGAGRRVKSVTNNSTLTTIFVYDAMGKTLAEYTNTNPPGGGTSYLTQDALGSTRIVTGTNPASPVKSRHDYLPFGEEITVPLGGRTPGQGYVADNVRQKFTGQERDLETGLDCFGPRYYSSAIGRFTSADSVAGSALNPQSMNLYGYVLNNPLALVDPTGHLPAAAYVDYDDDFRQIELHADTGRDEINAIPERYTAEPSPGQKQEESQALERGKHIIDAVTAMCKAFGVTPHFTFVQAGLRNPRVADIADDESGTSQTEYGRGSTVIGIVNDHGRLAGLSGRPNESAAASMVSLIRYAMSERALRPEQITLVAHSNGVPTLGLTLTFLDPNVRGFSRILMIAPNTDDVTVINRIGQFSADVALWNSTSDKTLRYALLGSRTPSYWASNVSPHIRVYETYQSDHAISAYAAAVKVRIH